MGISGDYRIDALLQGVTERWNAGTPFGTATEITYSFMDSVPGYYENFPVAPGLGLPVEFTPLDEAHRSLVRQEFAAIAQTIPGLAFIETDSPSSAVILIGASHYSLAAGDAQGFSPGSGTDTLGIGGDIWFNLDSAKYDITRMYGTLEMGRIQFEDMALHEIGHALGLKHPGNYSDGRASDIPPYLPLEEDNSSNTVMSYYGDYSDSQLRLYDILALNYLYGSTAPANGQWVLATGPSTVIVGSDRSEFILLNSSSGNHTVVGGAGNDTYVIGTGDTVVENPAEGTDTIVAPFTFSLAGLPNVENLTLTEAAGAANATGNDAANVITGNPGNNLLDGGAGNDTLVGGAGNDTFVVESTGDVVIENASGGVDTVQSSLSYTLGAEQENLTLAGSADINATGNSLDNLLTGNSGANVLDGGAGNDTLIGGRGDDTYAVDSAGDMLIEFSGQGRDTVVTPFSTVLAAQFENLTLSGTASVDATGNAAGNLLRGNAGNNVLDGGAGLDTMDGGAGNDTYVIDRLLEQGNISDASGVDTLVSSASYTGLQAGLENLVLTGNAWIGMGNAAANVLTGNARSNVLIGGAGNDTLDGGGGADLMDGVDGNDVFYVDNLGDMVIEYPGAGSGLDTVRSSVSFDLSVSGLNVERLELLGDAVAGTGNTLANTIVGNAMANLLGGGAGSDTLVGGAGNDILSGGAGNDVFVFNAAPGAANLDTVSDFVSGTDDLRFDNAVFTAIGLDGSLAAAAFNAGNFTSGQDASDRIIYNTTTGALYYDADGSGAIAAVQIAMLIDHPTLLAADIQVV